MNWGRMFDHCGSPVPEILTVHTVNSDTEWDIIAAMLCINLPLECRFGSSEALVSRDVDKSDEICNPSPGTVHTMMTWFRTACPWKGSLQINPKMF